MCAILHMIKKGKKYTVYNNFHYSCERLMTYLRADPLNPVLAELVVEMGRLLTNYDVNAHDLFQKQSAIFMSLRSRPEANTEIIDFLTGKYLEGTDESRIDEFDLKLLSEIYVALEHIAKTKNRELIYDYADAFHGLSAAIIHPNLDRAGYFDIYCKPFLLKWKKYFPKKLLDMLNYWKCLKT